MYSNGGRGGGGGAGIGAQAPNRKMARDRQAYSARNRLGRWFTLSGWLATTRFDSFLRQGAVEPSLALFAAARAALLARQSTDHAFVSWGARDDQRCAGQHQCPQRESPCTPAGRVHFLTSDELFYARRSILPIRIETAGPFRARSGARDTGGLASRTRRTIFWRKRYLRCSFPA